MSNRLRNAMLFCLTTSLMLSSSLTLQADTTTDSPSPENTVPTVSQSAQLNHVKNATHAEGYIPPNPKSETIYVNLDHYGLPTETQVVNGYRIDGTPQIIDYGNYTNVINLTNYTKPKIDGDQISWDLEKDTTHFYYQGTLKQIDLPWNFTIRYKLNGVETKAEALAGASGMIETIIDVTPNENVPDYLKNNFFLQLSTSYDMGKCLSVEAPDGVDVTLGATKSLTFMAMPGEEASFHIYVGSNCYESSGFNIVIAPLKMSALDTVSDLKDAKTRMEDAFDAASESLDIILDSTHSIKGGLTELNQGIASIQNSLQALRQDDNMTDEKVEKLLSSATTLNESLQTIVPHLDTAQTFITEINTSGNALVTDLKALSPLLENTKTCLEVLQADCTELNHLTEQLTTQNKNLNTSLDPLKNQLTVLASDLVSLEASLHNLGSGLDYSQSSLSQASNSLSDLSAQLDMLSHSITPGQIAQVGQLVASNQISVEQAQLLQSLMGSGNDIDSLNRVLSSTGSLASDSANLISVLRRVSTDVASLSIALQKVTTNIQDISSTLTSHSDTIIFTLDDLSALLKQLSDSTDIMQSMINDIDTAQNTINTYTPELIGFLQDASTLVTHTSETTTAATDLGTQIHHTITHNRQHTYDSIDQTLSASIHTFEDIIHSLGKTDDLKTNKDIIKNTIDEEWDKLDEDFNLLDYDPEALPISLVSNKNTNVDSIQIILRTPEISVDKKAEIEAEKAAQPELSVWDRIKNIFTTLF